MRMKLKLINKIEKLIGKGTYNFRSNEIWLDGLLSSLNELDIN